MSKPNASANSETSVLATAATGAAGFFQKYGGDVDRIFGRAGLNPSVASDPNFNISLRSYCNLFETAANFTGQDNIGLWFGQQFRPKDLGLLGYVSVHSASMAGALKNLTELFPYHQQATEMSLTRSSELLSLNYRIYDGHIMCRRQDAELSLGMFVNIFRHCYGPNWVPEEVHFEHPKPMDWHEHEKAFNAAVFFGQRANSLIFRTQDLERPMPTSDPRLHLLLRRCLKQVGIQQKAPLSLLDQISDHLLHVLPEGCPTLDEIAQALEMPVWTLQRRLSDHGVTYKELLEKIRKELAMTYLNQPHLPLTEIAFLLGYSELSAFSRAFHRWTGIAPRVYRARQNHNN